MALVAKFWLLLLMIFQNLRLVGIGLNSARPDWRMSDQTHSHHEIVIVVSGRQYAEMKGKRHTVSAGEAIWFPEHERHTEWADPQDPVRSYFLAFVCPGLPGLPQNHVTDEEGRLGLLARWLHAEREDNPSLSHPAPGAFAAAIAAEFFRLAAAHDNPLVNRLRRFMRRNLSKPLCLDDLVAQSGLSKFHFVRRYRAHAGRTPMEDLRLIRIAAVRDLLLTTALPLKEIAPRCGLRDEYHLSRIYRQVAGHPPGQLRRHWS